MVTVVNTGDPLRVPAIARRHGLPPDLRAEDDSLPHSRAGDRRLRRVHAPDSDLRIVVYTTPAGSDDADKLDLLRVTGVQTI
jgi:hypothetical protein